MKKTLLETAVAMLLSASSCLAADWKTLKLEYGFAAGVSYEPQSEFTISVDLEYCGKSPLDLSNAKWEIRRVREVVSNPKALYSAVHKYFEPLASGRIPDQSFSKNDKLILKASFTPGKYGAFTLLLNDETSRTPICSMAVVPKPAQGYRFDSPLMTMMGTEPEQLDIAGRLGMKWIRTSHMWPNFSDDGSINWSKPDRFTEAMRRNNMYLHSAIMPKWYNSPTIGGKYIAYTKNKKNMIVPPEDFEEYALFFFRFNYGLIFIFGNGDFG